MNTINTDCVCAMTVRDPLTLSLKKRIAQKNSFILAAHGLEANKITQMLAPSSWRYRNWKDVVRNRKPLFLLIVFIETEQTLFCEPSASVDRPKEASRRSWRTAFHCKTVPKIDTLYAVLFCGSLNFLTETLRSLLLHRRTRVKAFCVVSTHD